MTIKRVKKERDEIHFSVGPIKFEMYLFQLILVIVVIGVFLALLFTAHIDYRGKRISVGCTPVELPKK